MRIVFAGGGTGGHINPAISIADYIQKQEPEFEALFIGTERGLETKLVPKAGYPIRYIDICGFDRRRLWRNAAVLYKLVKSNADCRKILKEFKPDAVVCTGGYVSGPVAMAAAKLGIPSLIHEQNVYPGLTVRGSEKYVNYVAISFAETAKHMNLPEKCVLTGNPIRAEILQTERDSARKKLGLSEKPFVLVFGGSLGATKINETMIGVLEKMAAENKVQLLFGTGDRNYAAVTEAIQKAKITLPADIRVVPYIDNMDTVMAAADLVVARSGAITVSEIAALGKASVLIPSPNVVRNHQEQNAREFEAKGAAAVVTEDVLTPELLYKTIMEMVSDKEKLLAMGKNVKQLAKTDALEEIYRLVQQMAQ